MKNFGKFIIVITILALIGFVIWFEPPSHNKVVRYAIPVVKQVVKQKTEDAKSELIRKYSLIDGTRICKKCGKIIADPPMFIGYLGLNMRRYNNLIGELKSHKILCKCN